jgi:hypothetical protein
MTSKPDFIVITGTRRWSVAVRERLLEIKTELGRDWHGLVIHGNAPGVDTEAKRIFGLCWGISDAWEIFSRAFGKRWKIAGPVRNGAIAGAAGALMAFGLRGRAYAIPDSQSRGTWDCVDRLWTVGLDVEVKEIDG